MATLALILIKASLICFVGLALLGLAKFQSAFLRRYLTLITFAGMLFVVASTLLFTPVEIPLLPESVLLTGFLNVMASHFSQLPIMILAGSIYLAGLLFHLIHLLVDLYKLQGLTQQSLLFSEQRQPQWLKQFVASSNTKPTFYITEQTGTAAVWGVNKPVILLPANFFQLDLNAQQQMVVHEVFHIQHKDWLALMLGRFCCCLFWCLPWAWQLKKRLIENIENACDNAVIGSGHPAHSYANTLVQVIKQQQTNSLALSLTEKPFLFRRTEAILDRFTAREKLSKAYQGLIAIVCLGFVSLVSAVNVSTFKFITDDPDQKRYPLVVIEHQASPVTKAPTPPESTSDLTELQQLLQQHEPPEQIPTVVTEQRVTEQSFQDKFSSTASTRKNLATGSTSLKPRYAKSAIYKPVKTVMPIYPDRAIKKGQEATVTVAYNVLADGTTTNIKITRNSGKKIFEKPATDAIAQFLFTSLSTEPSIISQRLTTTFTFKLNGGSARHHNLSASYHRP